jgi:hypothetical protein
MPLAWELHPVPAVGVSSNSTTHGPTKTPPPRSFLQALCSLRFNYLLLPFSLPRLMLSRFGLFTYLSSMFTVLNIIQCFSSSTVVPLDLCSYPDHVNPMVLIIIWSLPWDKGFSFFSVFPHFYRPVLRSTIWMPFCPDALRLLRLYSSDLFVLFYSASLVTPVMIWLIIVTMYR